MKLNFKKYLIISALAIIMAGCETTTSEPTIDDPNNPKSLIAGIIERSPKAPNAKPEAEALRKKALRYVFLGDNLEEDTKNALSTINKAIEMDQANYSLYAARGLIHRDFVKDNDKALMTNPNKALSNWLLRDVLKLKEFELASIDKLEFLGIDSVIITKEKDGEYSIDIQSWGSYEKFIENFNTN